MAETLAICMFIASFYGLIVSKNAMKSIICIGLMEMAVIMFIISIGFASGMKPPIANGILDAADIENAAAIGYADPLPQALLLTAIVIGIAVTAVNVVLFNSLCRQYKETDWDTLKRRNLK